jgi:lysophospholipase L1-like esterase
LEQSPAELEGIRMGGIHRRRHILAIATILIASSFFIIPDSYQNMLTAAVSPEVCCFGDSLTLGSGSEAGCPPSLFGYPEFMDSMNPDDILNYGVAAETTYHASQRIGAVTPIFPAESRFVVLEGTNDLLKTVYTQEDEDTAVVNLNIILTEITNAGHYPYIATLPPVLCEMNSVSPEELNARIESLNERIRNLADGLGVPLVEVYDAMVALPNLSTLYNGCLHFYRSGYWEIANIVHGALYPQD